MPTHRLNNASKQDMRVCSMYVFVAALVIAPAAFGQASVSSQTSEPRAKRLIEAAVRSELAAAQADHSVWTYRDHDKSEKDGVYLVVDSPQGGLRRMVELNGRPVTPDTRIAETTRINAFINDPSAQAKQRKAGQHDDEQAAEMLKMLPNAFVWTLKSETAELATLVFRPDPGFRAPNMEARVMGMMGGELVIARADNRIRTLRGALTEDVKIGFGVLGKLRQGGTFDIERREIAPHIWQITETHVHIDGRALLFKTIGQQQDEVKTEWKPSTAQTLQEAAKQLGAG